MGVSGESGSGTWGGGGCPHRGGRFALSWAAAPQGQTQEGRPRWPPCHSQRGPSWGADGSSDHQLQQTPSLPSWETFLGAAASGPSRCRTWGRKAWLHGWLWGHSKPNEEFFNVIHRVRHLWLKTQTSLRKQDTTMSEEG